MGVPHPSCAPGHCRGRTGELARAGCGRGARDYGGKGSRWGLRGQGRPAGTMGAGATGGDCRGRGGWLGLQGLQGLHRLCGAGMLAETTVAGTRHGSLI